LAKFNKQMNKFTVIGGGGWAAAITKNVMRKSF
jgi:hypothetical protein